jgi:hypothetical protein
MSDTVVILSVNVYKAGQFNANRHGLGYRQTLTPAPSILYKFERRVDIGLG